MTIGAVYYEEYYRLTPAEYEQLQATSLTIRKHSYCVARILLLSQGISLSGWRATEAGFVSKNPQLRRASCKLAGFSLGRAI